MSTKQWEVAKTVILFFLSFIITLCLFLLAVSYVRADEVNIYDSPTDKKNIVVEYCSDVKAKECQRLVVDRKFAELHPEEMKRWLDLVLDKPK